MHEALEATCRGVDHNGQDKQTGRMHPLRPFLSAKRVVDARTRASTDCALCSPPRVPMVDQDLGGGGHPKLRLPLPLNFRVPFESEYTETVAAHCAQGEFACTLLHGLWIRA